MSVRKQWITQWVEIIYLNRILDITYLILLFRHTYFEFYHNMHYFSMTNQKKSWEKECSFEKFFIQLWINELPLETCSVRFLIRNGPLSKFMLAK